LENNGQYGQLAVPALGLFYRKLLQNADTSDSENLAAVTKCFVGTLSKQIPELFHGLGCRKGYTALYVKSEFCEFLGGQP
jgi:hypothetical protein